MPVDDDDLIEIAAARQREAEARRMALAAAAEYRRVVKDVVARWRADGVSMRASATRIGISEGALRDLLRPSGQPRRSRSPHRGTRPGRGGAEPDQSRDESPPAP